jgi:predicted aspartyl protease
MTLLYTHPYSQSYSPPMPVVEIELGVPGRSRVETRLMALVDSGADGTLVPLNVLEEIGARQVGEARIRGILETSYPVAVYLVNVRIGPHLVRAVRAVAAPEGTEAMLGRNVLNHLTITLNGPASMTEIAE